MGDCFGFVSECGMGLECDDVGRVLGQDWYEIRGVRVLLQIRFQSWSLNHHSQRGGLVENRRLKMVVNRVVENRLKIELKIGWLKIES